MIVEYHRPKTMDQALMLLERQTPVTLPMGGGTKLNRPSKQEIAVVDLQDLVKEPDSVFGQTRFTDQSIVIGGGVVLSALLELDDFSGVVKQTVQREYSQNLRNKATVAGTIVTADGRSPFVSALLSVDARVTLKKHAWGERSILISELLLKRDDFFPGNMLIDVAIPRNLKMAYQSISRTPQDFAIAAAVVCQWGSGRTRVVLSGHGPVPVTVFDGPEVEGVLSAASEAFKSAADEWAGAHYRSEMAKILVERCINSLSNGG